MKRELMISVAMAASSMLPAMADAQSVIMRRPLVTAPMQTTPVLAAHAVVQDEWTTTDWTTQGPACGTIHQTRIASCTGDACDPSTKPAEQQDVATGNACVYAWAAGDHAAWSSTCSDSATRTTSYSCTAHPTGDTANVATADDAACTTAGVAKPDPIETQPVYSGCTQQWVTGPWNGACGPVGISTRTISCQRSGTDYPTATVDDDYCDATTRPAATQDNATADTYVVCIPDASFENSAAGWARSGNVVISPNAHTGKASLQIDNYPTALEISFASVPGETYTASMWSRSDGSTTESSPFIALSSVDYIFGERYVFYQSSPAWRQSQVVNKATGSTMYLFLSDVNNSDAGNKVDIDDVQVIARRR